ncbi:MAG: segregation/condensation protein A [Eubacteriales bacterium]|nr:segregation/condensation protein A [Eubacteriales bacterium]
MEYKVSLSQFEGPLDLLLHLIEKAELNIEDIFLSQITSQYLSYMDDISDLDMDKASEFLSVAAQLVLIKSRQLLPRPPIENEDEEDPEQALIRQLRDYKLFKAAGEDLQQLLDCAKKSYTRLPEDIVLPPQKVELDQVDMDTLYDAFLTMLSRARETAPQDKSQRVKQDVYTIRRQINHVREILKAGGHLFTDLFEPDATKIEMVVTFMAVLELLGHGEIRLSQKGPFAPIRISIRELNDNDDEYTYMDEFEE